MKRILFLIAVSILFAVAIVAIMPTSSNASALVPQKIPVVTACCVGTALQGYANDCEDGSGSCNDRSCLAGETEKNPATCN